MAQILSFFSRQAVTRSNGAFTIYSEVYDASDIAELILDFQVFSFAGGQGLSAFLDDSPDPNLIPGSWRQRASFGLNTTTLSSTTLSQLHRFIRGRIYSSGTSGGIVSLEGIGREST